MFDDDWTPAHLTGGPTNLFKEIALALKGGAWRAVSMRMVADAVKDTEIEEAAELPLSGERPHERGWLQALWPRAKLVVLRRPSLTEPLRAVRRMSFLSPQRAYEDMERGDDGERVTELADRGGTQLAQVEMNRE